MQDSAAITNDGRADVRRAAAELAERLPDALGPLARLAYNYRWSWLRGGPELFAALDPGRFELCSGNPVRLLYELAPSRVRQAVADDGLLSRAVQLEALVQEELDRPLEASGDPARSAAGSCSPAQPVAFLCAEYAVHASLPIYSGGLGALAGDFLKQASDSALSLVAVGLLYRKGYFRQRIDAGGWQHEYWIDTDPELLPGALVTAAEGRPLTIKVPIYGREVTAQIWRVEVGRVPLFLLDTDVSDNGPLERWITARLYEADAQIRLAQYVLLGVGGIRAVRTLGFEPGVIHLNEGHAALAPLELASGALRGGQQFPDALGSARARTVFTTHTPLPAGNDSYPAEQVEQATCSLASELGCSPEDVTALGRTHPKKPAEPFGVTQAALRMSRSANGVSARHGAVAREMWGPLWPGRSPEEVPIGHVTNGVHLPTWIGVAMRELLDRHLGAGWMQRASDPGMWSALDQIADEELWSARERQRADLVAFIRRRSMLDRLLRSDVRDYVEAAARAFDPGLLTIGFARRVAAYKRLDLLIRDPEWTFSLLGGDRPVQVVLAGKAHPRDEEAKRALQRVFGMKSAKVIGARVVFFDDYDLSLAARLVRGCDVWLNVPRPPLEASGTSGMKAAINGALNLSVLDGWWAEAYDGENGWALPGEVDPDHQAQDQRDALALHRLLADEVLPAFYERAPDGVPVAWLARIRASLKSVGPQFCSARMLTQYEHEYRLQTGKVMAP